MGIRNNLRGNNPMNEHKKIETKPFPDDLGIRLVDVVRDPELIIKKIQIMIVKAKVICFNCHDFLNFRFTDTYYSFKCGCGMHIFYPPRSDRDFAYGYRFIPIEKFRRGYSNGSAGKIRKITAR